MSNTRPQPGWRGREKELRRIAYNELALHLQTCRIELPSYLKEEEREFIRDYIRYHIATELTEKGEGE